MSDNNGSKIRSYVYLTGDEAANYHKQVRQGEAAGRRYQLRTWIWDAHGTQRRQDDEGNQVHFATIEDAMAVGEARSYNLQIAIVEVFDHVAGKVAKVWVRQRGYGK